jgi:hypothetical protein
MRNFKLGGVSSTCDIMTVFCYESSLTSACYKVECLQVCSCTLSLHPASVTKSEHAFAIDVVNFRVSMD